MAIYDSSTEKQRKAQRVLNWQRRRAQRQGKQPKDFVTGCRPMVTEGRFSTK